MKNIIYNEKEQRVMAVADTGERAHDLAECMSYLEHANSVYGLFGMRLVSGSDRADDPDLDDACRRFGLVRPFGDRAASELFIVNDVDRPHTPVAGSASV